MKKILLVTASILFLVSSCTVEKRVYRNGFNVQWHAMIGHSQKDKNMEISSVEEVETVAKVLVPSKDNTNIARVYEMPTQEIITFSQIDDASLQSNSIETKSQLVRVKGKAGQLISVHQQKKEAKQISKQEMKALKKAVKSQKKSDDISIDLLYVLCFFVPFIVVGFVTDWHLPTVLINLLWCAFCWIPGIIHGLIILRRYI